LKEMKLRSRVVSHAFDMGEWKPDKQIWVDGRTVYFLYKSIIFPA